MHFKHIKHIQNFVVVVVVVIEVVVVVVVDVVVVDFVMGVQRAGGPLSGPPAWAPFLLPPKFFKT